MANMIIVIAIVQIPRACDCLGTWSNNTAVIMQVYKTASAVDSHDFDPGTRERLSNFEV